MKRLVLALLAVGSLAAVSASATPSVMGADESQGVTAAATLRQEMRRLWSEHTFWTRDYIIAALADQPDQKASADRLMKNQEDIGAVVTTYYGQPAGAKLTALLKEHISIAVDLVSAAKAGNKESQQKADTAWHQNGEQIADFLSQANPNWKRAVLVDMMNTHLSTTAAEVVARLSKDWEADVRALDAAYEHILHMSDALSDGIIKQFPKKF